MYILLNLLFGWDYVYWNDSVSHGTARVRILHDGTVFYWYSPILHIFEEIKRPDDVEWLTCKPDKYFKEATCDNS